MKQRSKKLLGILLSLVMVLGLIPGMSLTAWAGEPVELGADNKNWNNALKSTEDVTINGDVQLVGDTTLNIADGKTVKIKNYKSINLNGHNLTVTGTGTLTVLAANSNSSSPGSDAIYGGGTLIVNGANVSATGGKGDLIGQSDGGHGINCTVEVNSGKLTATGGENKGTGHGGNGIYGNLTINGGEVIATGGEGALGNGVGISGALTLGTGVSMQVKDNIYDDWSAYDGSTKKRYMETGSSTPATTYPVWVGGVQVTSANKDDVLGDTDTGATVKFAPATTGENATPATLTLNGANITKECVVTGDEGHSYIFYNGSDALTITLVGNNIVNENNANYCGIKSNNSAADITISGEGSLTVSGGNTNAIYCKHDVIIDSGTVIASGNSAIYARNGVTINEGTVTATSVGSFSYGIECGNGAIKISGGKVTATAIYSYDGNIDISGGTVVANSEDSAICANNGGVSISGSSTSVEATGMRGIWASTDVMITDSTVKASGTQGDSYGIWSIGDLTISGKSKVDATGRIGIKAGNITIGSDIDAVTVTGSFKAISGTVKNAVAGAGWTNVEGTMGKAVIAVSAEGQTLSYLKVRFPAPAAATVKTAPTAKTLTETGSAQALVNAGEAEGGTMAYALGENSATAPTTGWSADIPSGTDAGIYCVWYKAVGDETHTDSDPVCVAVTVAEEGQPFYTVTYDPNGGTGEMTDANSPYVSGATVTVKYNTFTAPANKEFTRWNTKADGTGTYFAPGATFDITADTVLYAQWRDIPQPSGGGSADYQVDEKGAGEFAPKEVEGMDDIAEAYKAKAQPGETITVTLTVTAEGNVSALSQAEQKEFAEGQQAIESLEAAEGQTVVFVNIKLEKDSSVSGKTDIGGENTKFLTIRIPFNTAARKNITVYRYHGDVAEAMKENPAEGEEGFKVEPGCIIIFAKNFSTYGIGFNEQTNTFDLYDGSADHKDVEVSLGGMSVYSVSADTEGDPAVTLNDYSVGSDTLVLKTAYLAGLAEGPHRFSVYEVANDTAVLAVTVEVVDTTPAASFVTVSEAHYHIILAETVNGTAKVSRTTAPRGATVTVTATPDEGYVLDAITAKDAKGNDVEVTDGKFTMPAADVTVSVSFVSEKKPLRFVDVPADAWYYDDVYWAAEKGIVLGTDETHFSPEADCTRAQFVTFLWRAAGKPAPQTAANPFEDVREGTYYYEAVLWASENGITTGTDAKHFTPDAPVTRAQVVTFLYRYEQSIGKGFTGLWAFQLDFPDAADVPEWAYEAFCWTVKEDVCKGSDGMLLPGAHCRRCEVAAFLARIFAENRA